METVQTELRKRKDTDLFFMILQQQRESSQNICSSPRFGSKGLNPWHCNTVVVDVILLWEKKDLQKPARQDAVDSHYLTSGLWSYQHSDNVYWEPEKGLQTYDRRKIAEGSWTDNLLHSILAQA